MKPCLMRSFVFILCIFPFFKRAAAQISFGPEVGFTASGLYNDNDVYAGVNLHVGATAHFQLTDFLAVRPSLLFKTVVCHCLIILMKTIL
jgi:hypothetical protein